MSMDSSSGALDLCLIPQPQHVRFLGAPLRSPPSCYLHLPASTLGTMRRRAQVVAQQLTDAGVRTTLGSSTNLTGYTAVWSSSPTVQRSELLTRPLRGPVAQPGGYFMSVNEDGVFIRGSDESGFLNGGQTLVQLMEDGREIPGLEIEDFPLLQNRAIHLDMRGWPPSKAYLEFVIGQMVRYKVNHLVLEYERFFNYHSQPGLAAEGALTQADLYDLDLYAQDRGVQLIPLLQSIGNVGYMLQLEPYRELREDPRYLQQLCPCHPNTLEIYTAMAEDLIGSHSAPYFHIGGDGARFLGICPACQSRAQQIGGRSSLYLEYIGKLAKYLVSRKRSVLLWDERVRGMTEDQVKWLPGDVVSVMNYYGGLGARASEALLVPLDRYKQLGRRVWGGASWLPVQRYENFDNLDAWAEAAELRYVEGLLTAAWTREFSLGPLGAPAEVAWPLALYAAERSWGGRKNCTREQFMRRYGGRFHGLAERAHQDLLWGVYDLMFRDYPREAREYLAQVYAYCSRNKNTLKVVDSWCAAQAFQYYTRLFERGVAGEYEQLQKGSADPFGAGRLRWRVQDLKSKFPELAKAFTDRMVRISAGKSAEEYLNCSIAYSMQRLDDLSGLLGDYPMPEKENQQPVRV